MDTVEANCSPALGELGNQFALLSLVALRQDVGAGSRRHSSTLGSRSSF